MLGRYNAGGLGVDARSIIGTTVATQQTIEEIIPTVEKIAVDYERISPLVNFVADYWYTVLAVVFLTGAVGSTVGSWFVLRRLEKK